jgi:hypothetical protein
VDASVAGDGAAANGTGGTPPEGCEQLAVRECTGPNGCNGIQQCILGQRWGPYACSTCERPAPDDPEACSSDADAVDCANGTCCFKRGATCEGREFPCCSDVASTEFGNACSDWCM